MAAVAVLWIVPSVAPAAAPTGSAWTEAARWTAAKFGGVAESPPEAPPGLVVLVNNDPVQRNARGGRPMRIVDTEFTRGLYCHAFSKIIVRLPGPGDVFTAMAGVDSNEQTREGRGSVRFAVLVDGAEEFKSAVMREGMAGVPVDLEIYRGVVHGFINLGRAIPEALTAHADAARALRHAFQPH